MSLPKIAISGKMASGKSYLAHSLVEDNDYSVYSLGGKVKDIAYDLFKMSPDHKDRPLLQGIGMKMRDLQPDVWITYVLTEAEENDGPVVCDDVRFVNEARAFKDAGWLLVKLQVEDDLQLERLQNAYPDNWESHWSNRTDPSETEVDDIPDEWFDLILTAANDDMAVDTLREFLNQI